MRKQKREISSPIKQKVLLLLLAGTTLSLTKSYKKQRQIIHSIPKAWKLISRQYLYRIIDEFHYNRLIDWQENKDGTISIVLTEKGKLTARQFDPDNLKIIKLSRWDKHWRMVIYDIPDKKKSAREALRRKLTELGFKEWQKSVFVHPYPCRDQIDFIIEFFDIRPYVRYAELINPTNEAELKLHFNL
ncbi:MAG: hypothetical protein COV09_01695 [Candidatus Vogelbacteria bacterium CG10_big_fil_rev_8_21_14_0_10_50_13]|uniref:Transcriptional repressor PaaX-like central Cas2-like domain-containing protein n=1 Tax=Candidatus Vogelbacteria bacterium CG10_big_fil_rev_8_21_14_0_10_50_13 TaxID=1975044 RepID=A0A2H0RHZ0_9BACT|nr:MAG: hypothetical protein COV09_01695 [Candidatus Vogelbacteria bacterium CG10_big_fil_rev_8_21_14_0_10_50_13]